MTTILLLSSAIVACVLLAAIFAGSETAIYQMSRIRLRLGVEQKKTSFLILAKILRDPPAILISILIGTNFAHYIITSIATSVILPKVHTAHIAELLATLITAPLLFIFAELIPKNIFFYRADSLIPRTAPILYLLKIIFTKTGIVSLLKWLSNLLARITHAPPSSQTIPTAARHSHLKAISAESHEEDFLSATQADIINRLEAVSHLSIKNVMTPLHKAETADINSDKTALLKILDRAPFTNLPVYEASSANIIGFVNIYECLTSPQNFSDLTAFVKPIRTLPADTIVSDAIKIMQTEHRKIILATRPHAPEPGKPIGLITMKDLVEQLFGELTEW